MAWSEFYTPGQLNDRGEPLTPSGSTIPLGGTGITPYSNAARELAYNPALLPTLEDIQQIKQEMQSGNTAPATTEPAPVTPYEPSLEEKLQLQDQWLRAQHMSYLDALRNYSNAYSNTLAALAQRINSPESQVGFSLGGEAPVSWVPRQTLRTAGTLEGLANKAYTTGLAVPTEIWGYQQQHPLYSPDLRYFDIIHNLANASEAMRYGIPTTTQVGDITGPPVSPMTQIGALGQLINTGMDIYRGGKDLGWWGGGNIGGGGGSSNWFDMMTGGGGNPTA